MIIKEGYGSKPLEINVSKAGEHHGRKAELWIEMIDGTKVSDYQVTGDDLNSDKFRTETLHYVTLDELLQLRDSINDVIKELVQ